MTRIVLHTHLEASPDQVWDWLEQPAVLREVTKPLMTFKPIEPDAFPERWDERDYLCALRLWGLIPLGRQVIDITLPPFEGYKRFVRDNGHSARIKRWDHLITIEPEGEGTRYEDRLDLDAGLLTPLVAAFAKVFYGHRQSRWRELVKRGHLEGGSS